MIEVCTPPTIDQEPGGDFQLCFWVLDVFNYGTPFRTMLAEAADALGCHPASGLHLPAYMEGEDFIEGTLDFGSTTLRVYFEHSRSYLSITHSSKRLLEDVLRQVMPLVRVRG
jgi:hypothetical protein